jgi:hypothetical protein
MTGASAGAGVIVRAKAGPGVRAKAGASVRAVPGAGASVRAVPGAGAGVKGAQFMMFFPLYFIHTSGLLLTCLISFVHVPFAAQY